MTFHSNAFLNICRRILYS